MIEKETGLLKWAMLRKKRTIQMKGATRRLKERICDVKIRLANTIWKIEFHDPSPVKERVRAQ